MFGCKNCGVEVEPARKVRTTHRSQLTVSVAVDPIRLTTSPVGWEMLYTDESASYSHVIRPHVRSGTVRRNNRR